MADTPEQQAVNGATNEGRMAALQGMAVENCPYADIAGGIGDQRKAWLAAFNKAKS